MKDYSVDKVKSVLEGYNMLKDECRMSYASTDKFKVLSSRKYHNQILGYLEYDGYIYTYTIDETTLRLVSLSRAYVEPLVNTDVNVVRYENTFEPFWGSSNLQGDKDLRDFIERLSTPIQERVYEFKSKFESLLEELKELNLNVKFLDTDCDAGSIYNYSGVAYSHLEDTVYLKMSMWD